MRRTAYALIVLFAASAGAVAVILFVPSGWSSGTQDDSNLAFVPHPGAQLPSKTPLRDENGRGVTLGAYFNRQPVILVLDYLRCTSLCGVTLRNIVEDLDASPLVAGRDYELLSVSIDPRDTAADATAAKAKYVSLLHDTQSSSAIHFLTGSRQSTQSIADVVGFPYRYDKMLDAYIHPAGFVIVDREGKISRYIEGVAVTPQTLIDGLGSANAGKPQDLVSRIVLFCHLQGALLGRFTVPVLAAFMAAEIAAALAALTIFVAVARRRG